MTVFTARAQDYTFTDSDSVPEPWSGWWWPEYHVPGEMHCPYCPHLWQGLGFDPGSPGPIYDLDTKYFWRPESTRLLAQKWEDSCGHVTNSSLSWFGHCGGTSCAQAIEPDPPTDCGALSQDDLEGLLAESYAGHVHADPQYPGPHIDPGSFWFALQRSMRTAPKRALVVDFFADTGNVVTQTAWFWPVYWYRVDYNIVGDSMAYGEMTLLYEDHCYGTDHASRQAAYGFWCVVRANRPVPRTGAWGGKCEPPPGCDTVPDWAERPLYKDTSYHDVNPYLNYDEIKRVIDHKTIVMDDAYMDSMYVSPPPDTHPRVRRPGFADSCWATDDTTRGKYTAILWCPRLACSGPWSFYVYKTHPADGDTLDPLTDVGWGIPVNGNGQYWTFSQAVPPFDTWQLLGSHSLTQESAWIFVLHWDGRFPYHYFTYFDAVKLEFNGGGLEGGASSATFALSGESQRTRVTPNPVRRAARISYVVPSPGPVEIVVYDVAGKAVQSTSQVSQRAGAQKTSISVAGLPMGTYVARVSVNGEHSTCKFVVSR